MVFFSIFPKISVGFVGMERVLSTLENLPPELREMVETLQAELATKDAVIEKLGGELKRLREQFELMVKRMYGKKSEKLDPKQVLMEELMPFRGGNHRASGGDSGSAYGNSPAREVPEQT